MIYIYCASGFANMHNLVNLVKESMKSLDIPVNFIIPQMLEDENQHEYVFWDMKNLDRADALLIHLPEPSVGAAAELGYFKAKHPHSPIICFKCMKHGWLERLCDLRVNDAEDLVRILKNIWKSKEEIMHIGINQDEVNE
jgi:nucleoside 2-deoxyribosyltransferase